MAGRSTEGGPDLVSAVASLLMRAPSDDLTRTVELVLAELSDRLEADRVLLVLIDEDGEARVAHRWPAAADAEAERQILARLGAGETPHADAVAAPEPLAAGRARLVAPMHDGRGLAGALAIEAPPGPLHAEALRLSVVARFIQHALERERLRLHEERYRRLVELSPDAVFLVSGGAIVFVNDAAVRLLGARCREDLVARPATLLQPEPAVSDSAGPAVPTESPGPALVEERWRDLSGAPVSVEVTRLASSHEGREATQIVARDVTERKQLAARLVAVDRMVAMATLAAGIGHEINNPLSYVLGNLDQARSDLEAGTAVPEEVIGLLAEAESGAARIRDVVRDLRTFTRASEPRRGPVSLEVVVDSAVRMAHNEIRHRAKLVRRYQPVAVVEGNDGRLRQVVLNLLINSAHAIREGSAADNEIEVTLVDEGDQVAIGVRDTGSGMSTPVLQRIFEPFFTTKPAEQGTGLGLTISRQIVEEHRGRIDVESQPGQGTTVIVRLPKIVPHGGEQPSAAGPLSAPAGRPHLLVVDDEPIICRTAARLLAGDYEVTTMTSGLDALDRLRHGPCPYDLILCDLMMPDLTGMDLYAAVNRQRPEIARRFVFVTGGAFTPLARSFVAEMGGRVLEKPLDGDRLRALVRLHLAR